MTKDRVLIVQNQQRLTKDRTRFENKFDFTAAQEFGEIQYLLGPTASPFHPADVIVELNDKLKDYCADGNDYLLLTGNPALIGMVCAIAADCNNGDLKLLQWHGKDRRYIPIEVNCFKALG